jgi:diadenosine tetraphosphate (Ap4A) HIT family hydrolase
MTGKLRCITCELVARRDAGAAPLWDQIHRSPFWDIVHCNATSLPGWLVLVVRRHVSAIDELTVDEAHELGVWIRLVSKALKEVVNCERTYVIQFAEAEGHRHVHFHIIPRMADQPADSRGVKVFSHLGVPEDERVSEAQMNEIGRGVRKFLQGNRLI